MSCQCHYIMSHSPVCTLASVGLVCNELHYSSPQMSESFSWPAGFLEVCVYVEVSWAFAQLSGLWVCVCVFPLVFCSWLSLGRGMKLSIILRTRTEKRAKETVLEREVQERKIEQNDGPSYHCL